MRDFTNQVVVITGASTGIGRATAIAFYRAGARLVLAARTIAQLEQLSTEFGGHEVALPVAVDVAEPEQCQALIDRAVAHFGGIDILVNNAGMVVSGPFEHLHPGDMERQFAVNYFGVVNCTRAALPYLKQSRGVVINVSSVAGFIGTPTSGAYSASKAALNNLGQSLSAELQRHGIAVVTVCPYFTSGAELSQKGILRTGSLHAPEGVAGTRVLSRLPRRAPGTQTVEEVAASIVAAAAKRPRLVVLSPYGRMVWRLQRLAPWLVDRVLPLAVR